MQNQKNYKHNFKEFSWRLQESRFDVWNLELTSKNLAEFWWIILMEESSKAQSDEA